MLHKPVETAKAAGMEPRAYLHYLFETLQAVTNPEVFKALLPPRITPGELKVSVLVL
jgi:transposase